MNVYAIKSVQKDLLGKNVILGTHDANLYIGKLASLPTESKPVIKLVNAWQLGDWEHKADEFKISLADTDFCERNWDWQAPTYAFKR